MSRSKEVGSKLANCKVPPIAIVRESPLCLQTLRYCLAFSFKFETLCSFISKRGSGNNCDLEYGCRAHHEQLMNSEVIQNNFADQKVDYVLK